MADAAGHHTSYSGYIPNAVHEKIVIGEKYTEAVSGFTGDCFCMPCENAVLDLRKGKFRRLYAIDLPA